MRAAAFPPLYFADDRGNELAIFRSGDDPRGELRVPTRYGADRVSGPLQGEQGHLMITMWFGEEGSTGLRAHVRHDPEFQKVHVECEAIGETAVGLPIRVPDANGEYRPVEPGQRLALARKEAAAAEQQLGATLARLGALTVPHPKFLELLAGQQEWATSRGDGSDAAQEDGSGDFSGETGFWQNFAEQTRERELLLIAASGTMIGPGYGGDYIDGFGGHLTIGVVGGEGRDLLDFSFFVVRGPTAHTGEISGIANFTGETTATFVDTDAEAFWEGKPATLRFELDGHVVSVEGENTMSYHGARAFFDGTYFRLPEL